MPLNAQGDVSIQSSVVAIEILYFSDNKKWGGAIPDPNGYYKVDGLPLNTIFVVVVKQGNKELKNLAFSAEEGIKRTDLTPTTTVTVELVSKNRNEVVNANDIGSTIDDMQKTVDEYYSAHTDELNNLTDALDNGADIVIPEDIEEDTVFYTLTIGVSPNGAGTVSPNSGTKYLKDTKVTLSATANAGYEFKDWTGDVNNNEIEMTGDKSITANFSEIYVPAEYALTVVVSPNGGNIITKMPEPVNGTYTENTEVTLTAVPSDNFWAFSHWGNDESDNANPKLITMSEDKTVTANFVKIPTVILRVPKSFMESSECRLVISTVPLQPRKEIQVQVTEYDGVTNGTYLFYEYVFSKNTAVTFLVEDIPVNYGTLALSLAFAENETLAGDTICFNQSENNDEGYYHANPVAITLTRNINWVQNMEVAQKVPAVDFTDFTSLNDDKYLLPFSFTGEADYIKGIRLAKDAENLYVRMDVDDDLLDEDGAYKGKGVLYDVSMDGHDGGIDLQYHGNNSWTMAHSDHNGDPLIFLDRCVRGNNYVGWIVPIDHPYLLPKNMIYSVSGRAGTSNNDGTHGPWDTWPIISETSENQSIELN